MKVFLFNHYISVKIPNKHKWQKHEKDRNHKFESLLFSRVTVWLPVRKYVCTYKKAVIIKPAEADPSQHFLSATYLVIEQIQLIRVCFTFAFEIIGFESTIDKKHDCRNKNEQIDALCTSTSLVIRHIKTIKIIKCKI